MSLSSLVVYSALSSLASSTLAHERDLGDSVLHHHLGFQPYVIFGLWKILVWVNLFEFIRVYVLRLVGFHCHLIFLFVVLFLDFRFSFLFWRRRIAVRATYSISRQRSCYPPLQIAWPLYMTSGESRTFTNQDNPNQFITDVWNNIVSQDVYE